jgi:hypothetical protein
LSDHNAIKLELNNTNKQQKIVKQLEDQQHVIPFRWVIEEAREERKMLLEFTENESITYQNLRDTAKEVLRGKFIAMSANVKTTEKSQIND